MYCCGECEVLAEETHNLSEDEYNELDDLYFHYYSNNFIPSPADLGRMIVLENKASEEEVRGLLENYGTSPIKNFVKEFTMDKKLLNKFAKIIKDIDLLCGESHLVLLKIFPCEMQEQI